ncbi:hypothetical protein R3P38DRAFT_2924370 [Favolaschia claudopus]|uniref:Uncharacterized protein n=1 Tax=Favolaschia claudopus TaxID=2862362 RepID=A0AAW0C082_9AGAR
MSSASSSTATLVTVSSRTPLNRSTTVKAKDFQAAFASLQSTYGFPGSAPSPVPKKFSSSPSTSAKSSPSVPVSAPSAQNKAKRDYRSAFGNLQSTFGFGGAAPCPVPKSSHK